MWNAAGCRSFTLPFSSTVVATPSQSGSSQIRRASPSLSRSWCDAHTSHCQSYSASAESSTNCISPAIDRTLPPPTTSIDALLISTQPSAGAVEL